MLHDTWTLIGQKSAHLAIVGWPGQLTFLLYFGKVVLDRNWGQALFYCKWCLVWKLIWNKFRSVCSCYICTTYFSMEKNNNQIFGQNFEDKCKFVTEKFGLKIYSTVPYYLPEKQQKGELTWSAHLCEMGRFLSYKSPSQ